MHFNCCTAWGRKWSPILYLKTSHRLDGAADQSGQAVIYPSHSTPGSELYLNDRPRSGVNYKEL